MEGLKTADQLNTSEIPFIRFLYADGNGDRKIYDADWPDQFIAFFKDKEVTEIGGFFMMGVCLSIRSLEDAIKICMG